MDEPPTRRLFFFAAPHTSRDARSFESCVLAVSQAWPPCVNGMCCNSKDKPGARYTQKGVGAPIVRSSVYKASGGQPANTEMSR